MESIKSILMKRDQKLNKETNMKTMELIEDIKKLRKEQEGLWDQLEKSLAIESEIPNAFKDGKVALKHYEKMLPYPSRKTGVIRAYLETEKLEKIPISKELYTKLTGKTNFHEDYNEEL